jgi:hypothetical protein
MLLTKKPLLSLFEGYNEHHLPHDIIGEWGRNSHGYFPIYPRKQGNGKISFGSRYE